MKRFLKGVWETIWNFLHAVGQVTAAAHFARTGDHKSARAIMNVK
jgi:hypothetical protein